MTKKLKLLQQTHTIFKMSDLAVSAAMLAIKATVFVYDVVTFPLYLVLQRPWSRMRRSRRVKAVSKTGRLEGPYVTTEQPLENVQAAMAGMSTLVDGFEMAVKKHQLKKCLGMREILGEEDEVQPNGKVFKKFVLGDYQWQSFDRVAYRVNQLAKALRSMMTDGDDNKVVLFAETRDEWIIACIACFKNNIKVVTLYTTLGDEALIHGINETESSLVITSSELLPKFKKLLSKTPTVKQLIYMEGRNKSSVADFPANVDYYSFKEAENLGKSLPDAKFSPPTKNETAIIMYTSGSTGIPKGVILTHGNLMSTLKSFSNVVRIKDEDVYMAYLPLAHVLELLAEFMCVIHAIPIGYSSPNTLANTSSKVKKGCKGDANVLQPTFMACVPLILDRIFKTVNDAVADKGGKLTKAFFQFACEYKLYYLNRGFKTPIIDKLVFQRVRNMLGGRLRGMATGGAPLSPDTHNFVRVCLSVPILQAYGLTETCACATAMALDDLTVGRCGGPLSCSNILLENWEEGNYHVTDKPYPRGEVIIGGENVCAGYYKLDKANEDFFEKDGKRWFRTGDIGEVQEDGCFRIIDRKKDLVKLQGGEYVSLGKVESQLKTLNVVDNVCVFGDSMKTFTVALIVPNRRALEALAQTLNKGSSTFEQLCDDVSFNNAVAKLVFEHGVKGGLERFEIPTKAKLCSEIWTPDNELVTAAFKLKRKNIETKYKSDINKMYS